MIFDHEAESCHFDDTLGLNLLLENLKSTANQSDKQIEHDDRNYDNAHKYHDPEHCIVKGPGLDVHGDQVYTLVDRTFQQDAIRIVFTEHQKHNHIENKVEEHKQKEI